MLRSEFLSNLTTGCGEQFVRHIPPNRYKKVLLFYCYNKEVWLFVLPSLSCFMNQRYEAAHVEEVWSKYSEIYRKNTCTCLNDHLYKNIQALCLKTIETESSIYPRRKLGQYFAWIRYAFPWNLSDDRPSIYVAHQETNYMLETYYLVSQKCNVHHN